MGGTGGIYQFAVGSGNGTMGFNSYGGGYVAGVNGLGGLFQFTLADGKLIYFNESNVSAGNSHGHTVAFAVDGSRRFGIGTSSPVSVLDVIGAAADPMEVRFSTSTSIYHVAVSTNGHLMTQGTAPAVSSCGSTPNGSVVGNDISGVVTIGGGVVMSCTVTFTKPYETNAPSCFLNDASNILFTEATTTTSALTINATVNFAGDSISYFCVGRQ